MLSREGEILKFVGLNVDKNSLPELLGSHSTLSLLEYDYDCLSLRNIQEYKVNTTKSILINCGLEIGQKYIMLLSGFQTAYSRTLHFVLQLNSVSAMPFPPSLHI